MSAGLPRPFADEVVVRYRTFREDIGAGSPLSLAARLGLKHRSSPEFAAILRLFAATELGSVRAGATAMSPRRDARGDRHYEAA